MDFVTPPITVPEGRMIAGRNFEPWINGGYRRIAGYERYDGQPKPSDSSWAGVCLDAAFDPTIPAIPGDDDYSSVVTLLPFDGVDGAIATDCEAGTPRTWNFLGDAQLDTAQSVYGGASLLLDGAGDYLTDSGAAADWNFLHDGSDYTLEGWVRPGQIGVFACIASTELSTTRVGAGLSINASGQLDFIVCKGSAGTVSGRVIGSTVLAADTWYHAAVQCSAGVIEVFLNGVSEGIDTLVSPSVAAPTSFLNIGRYTVGDLYHFNGHIDDFRVTEGVVRYTGPFTPPVAAHPIHATIAPGVAATITGNTSGATGTIIDSEGACVYITKVDGTFEVAETITVGVTDYTVEAVSSELSDNIDHEATLRLAAETRYRTDIQQVPGANAVRGIWQIRDRVYAIRDNPGETAGVIYKASSSGWDAAALDLAHYVYFTGGLVEPAIGDTLDGATSAATGTIHKIVVHTGNWGTSDASGYFTLTGVTGAYSDTENLQVAAVTQAVAAGASEQFALPVGGRYSFVSENFYAGADTYRVYASGGGVGPGFEIDENDVVTPILMDLTMGDAPSENRPHLVEAWDGCLWFAFAGGSVQHSIVGDPLVFNGFLGAAEYGLGDEVTTLNSLSGDVLVARTRRQTHAFYKGDIYTKKIISDRAGGILYSDQELNTSYAADDSGITNLMRVQEYGDFGNATISDLIQPYLAARKELVAGSMVVRDSNQYRLLYSNGEGAIARINPNGAAEFGILSYPTTVHCAYSCENEDGTPTNWFGGSSGYVYQAEIGRNFDGAEIEATARMPFNHQGQPEIRKRYRLVELELSGERAIELYMAADLSYSGPETGAHYWEDRVVGGGGFFDADNWDQIYWDAQQFSTARFELLGTGKNISLLFYSRSNTTAPFILQGAQLHFDLRRVQR